MGSGPSRPAGLGDSSLRQYRVAAGLVLLLAGAQAGLLSGCASLAGSAAGNLANELSGAILDQDDPELVRDSLPAYLLLLDALARSPDAGSRVLDAAARLNAAYAVVFLREPERASLTAEKARTYGVRALCAANRKLCGMDALGFEAFEDRMDLVRLRDTGALLGYATGSLAFIRTHSDDWQALADLPRVEAALKRLLALGPGSASDAATVNTYLGVLNSLRPPALGGRPEEGRAYFERAITLTGGADLSVMVEFARTYCRLVYDRERHDELLNRVLAADPRVEGYTLVNRLAQSAAAGLLASADDYF